MFNLDPLMQLVDLLTGFLPFIIIFGVVLFFIGLIFKILPSNSKITKRLRIDNKFLYPMLGLSLLLFLGLGFGPVHATQVSMSLDSSLVFGDTLMTVKCSGLTVDTEYTIWASGNSATINNATFKATSSIMYIPMPTISDTDGYTLLLAQSSAGVSVNTTATSTAGASLFIAPTAVDQFFPTGFFFALMVPMILILVVVAIAKGFVGGSKNNRGD